MILLRQVVLAWLFLSLTGCSGTMERMSTWMGVQNSVLIEKLGKPHRSYEGQFGLVQSWYRDQENKIGCTDDFVLRNGVVISFASNCGIFGGWAAPVYEL